MAELPHPLPGLDARDEPPKRKYMWDPEMEQYVWLQPYPIAVAQTTRLRPESLVAIAWAVASTVLAVALVVAYVVVR